MVFTGSQIDESNWDVVKTLIPILKLEKASGAGSKASGAGGKAPAHAQGIRQIGLFDRGLEEG
jgi:hypothetical protein